MTGILERLREITDHDWRSSLLAHTSDTAREAALEIKLLRAELVESRKAYKACPNAMKIWPADKWFSLCVRERADWRCEVCFKQYGQGMSGLECSHYCGRANKSTRWDPDNCWAHCTSCHFRLGGHPAEFYRWVVREIGSEAEQKIYEKSKTVLRVSKKDRDLIAAHYKAELERMRALRDGGVLGRVSFKDWCAQ